MHDYTRTLGDSLLAAQYSAIVPSATVIIVLWVRQPENVFFIVSLGDGSCHLKDTGKRNILNPETQLLEPLNTHGFVCLHKLPLISSWLNFNFKSTLTSE